MKKSEIIALLNENNVKTSNVKTFVSKNKKLKLDAAKCAKWLTAQEDKDRELKEKKETREQAKKFKMSIRAYIELQIKAAEILSDFHTGHSMGCYKTLYINNVPFLSLDCTQDYARSCKWRPTYGHVRINLRKCDLIQLQRDNEGVWNSGAIKLIEKGIKGTYEVLIEKL